jgi:hypothetical protein
LGGALSAVSKALKKGSEDGGAPAPHAGSSDDSFLDGGGDMKTFGTTQMSDSEIDEQLRGDICRIEGQRDELLWLLARMEETLAEHRDLLTQVQIRRCRSIPGLEEID